MVFPLGEWLLFSLGFLAWIGWPIFRFAKSLRILPLVWFLGWIFEHSFTFSGVWNWQLSRIFVLIVFTGIAWKNASERRVSSLLLVGICLLVQDLFVLNEPGILAYDQWLFATLFVGVAFFSTRSIWGMSLALAGGLLLNIFFTIFFFDGVVRYYNLPNSFLWHFSIGSCVIIAALKQLHEYWQDRKNLRLDPEFAVQEPGREEGRVYRKDD